MRTDRCLFLAAAIALGGIAATASGQDPQPGPAERAGQRMDRAADRAGQAMQATTQPGEALAPDAEDIRETLKSVTHAAFTKGGFDDLVERFVDADRNRLGQDGFPEREHQTLDGRIAQLQKDWKAKYDQDFKMSDKEEVFTASFAQIIQSEIGQGARLAGERTPAEPGAEPRVDAPRPRDDTQRLGGGDTNREPGRNIATVTIPAGHGLPELRVPLIHEFPDVWRIDIPDNYSAQQLHDNLLKHLTSFNEQKDQWPNDPNEAYRAAAHHVLTAVMNVDATEAGQGMDGGMMPHQPPQAPGGAAPPADR